MCYWGRMKISVSDWAKHFKIVVHEQQLLCFEVTEGKFNGLVE